MCPPPKGILYEGVRKKEKKGMIGSLLSPPLENEEEAEEGVGKKRRQGKRRKGTCIQGGFFSSSPYTEANVAWQKVLTTAQNKSRVFETVLANFLSDIRTDKSIAALYLQLAASDFLTLKKILGRDK